jgi:hypothetical protein
VKRILFLLCFPLAAQVPNGTANTPPAAPAPVAPSTTAALPQNWLGIFAGYAEKVDGTLCGAILVSQSAQAYSYSCYHAVPQHNAVPITTLQTGVALLLRSFGPVSLYALGTGGTATSSTAITAAFSGGGLLVWNLPKNLTLQLGFQMDKAGSATVPDYMIGIGYRFAK